MNAWPYFWLAVSVLVNVGLLIVARDLHAIAKKWKQTANLEFEMETKRVEHDTAVRAWFYTCPKCDSVHPLGQSCRYARKLASTDPS